MLQFHCATNRYGERSLALESSDLAGEAGSITAVVDCNGTAGRR